MSVPSAWISVTSRLRILPHLAVLLQYGTYLAREEHVTHGSNRKFRTHFISLTFRTQSAPQDIQ